jgi:hypothetical protein
VLLIREFKLCVLPQTANARQRFYGIRQQRVNELAVLKLQCMIILSTQERKYETKTFNENFAKNVRTCRLPFPETRSLNSLFIVETIRKLIKQRLI